MTKDGAGSRPGVADLGSTPSSAVVPAESVTGKVADENATIARPAEKVRPPRPPMPHAKIRPTASFPRVASAVLPPRPQGGGIPSLVVAEDEDEEAVTQHKGESIDKVPTAAIGEINDAMTMARAAPPPRPAAGGRPNDDVTRAQPSPLVAARMSMQMSAPVPAPPASLKPVLQSSSLQSVASPDFTVEIESGSGVSSGARKSAGQDAHSATTLVQGDVIGGVCRIEERLALSEMSVLYRAFHLQLERMVVVKVLQDAGVENVEAVARFRREARLMSLVTSEHVAKVLDVGSHEGCPFIVMERLEGADLAYLMKQTGRMPLRQACDLVLQICEALAVAHSYGIVHRDLKPANVFVSVRAGGDLRVTIIDFGIAKAFFQQKDAEDQLTKVDGLLGSPRYMAPEQVEPRMEVDERADIWALGIIFQEILTGERVFNADGVVQLLMAIVESAPVPLRKHLADAPDAIVATVAQALEKDPTRRLPNALTFAARVAPFASPDALQRVANIAGIAAAAVERAAESRPSFQERATLPPKSPAALGVGPSPVDVASIPPASPRSATLPSSNPPPTIRLPRELIVSPPVAPAMSVVPVVPVVPPATAPAGLVVPTGPMMTLANEPVTAVDAVAAVDPRDEIAGLDGALDAALADGRDRRKETVKINVDDVLAARPRVRSRTAVLIAVVWVAIAVGAAMVAHAVLSGPSPASSAVAPDTASPSTAATPSTATTAAPDTTAPAPAASGVASASAPALVPAESAETTAASSAPSASASAARPLASATSLPVISRPAASASAVVAAGAPAPAANGTGTLTVVCLPKCDQILDNGAVLGNGYVFGQQVAAGHHTLSLSSSNGVKKTLPVDIPASGTKELRVSMEK